MVAFREAGRSDIRENDYAAEFFDVEYRVDYLIHTYAKPILCWGHGIVMGGGIGLMSGASHRVVSERSKLAFPEITVGPVPRCRWQLAAAARAGQGRPVPGLTGALLNPGDAIYAGLADVHVAEERRSAVFDALLQVAWSGDAAHNHERLSQLLQSHASDAVTGPLLAHAAQVDAVRRR
jgi:enoyl-CoA hydratase/carnithine racemase